MPLTLGVRQDLSDVLGFLIGLGQPRLGYLLCASFRYRSTQLHNENDSILKQKK